jgi:hypothetical protein
MEDHAGVLGLTLEALIAFRSVGYGLGREGGGLGSLMQI